MTVYPQIHGQRERTSTTTPCTPTRCSPRPCAAAEAELGDTGRVLLRPSGTEPLVRVMVEAADQATADRIAHSLADVVRERLGL